MLAHTVPWLPFFPPVSLKASLLSSSEAETRILPRIHLGLEHPFFTISARGVAASRFLGRQELMAYKVLVLTLGSMITIPMVWSM